MAGAIEREGFAATRMGRGHLQCVSASGNNVKGNTFGLDVTIGVQDSQTHVTILIIRKVGLGGNICVFYV